MAAQPRLLAIAVRVLGDVGEAQEVVQEAWLRWQRSDRSAVVNPPAFLATTTARLAINVAQSARKRREYVAGPALPDVADRGADPAAVAERHDALDGAVRLMLAKMTAAERAAYLLRKAFDYPYRKISAVLGVSGDSARQLVRRAHERLGTDRNHPVDPAVHRRLVRVVHAAARTGDLGELEQLLAATLRR
ncbi:sigma factor [Actinoplanes solisilvae]|uniref:sigma factor n=1 Tax=Actinoplanes solisilvae TaxID=2486853 RepID=UPI00196AC18A|nr:sigma factor-like helix-turn-helix DNA-binding protein [Actinoplanes solisilvae]